MDGALYELAVERRPGERHGTNTAGELSESARRVASGLRRPSLSPVALGALARGIDLAIVTLALWFAEFAAAPRAIDGSRTALAAFAAAAMAVVITGWAGKYRLSALSRFLDGWTTLSAAGLAAAALGSALGFWMTPAPIYHATAAAALLLASLPGRLALSTVAAWARDYGLSERRAVVVGGGKNAMDLLRGLESTPENDIRVCGIFDDRDDDRSPAVVMGVPKIGHIGDLVSFARTAEIDMLIVTLPLSAERRIRQILAEVRVLPLDVRLSAYSEGYAFRRRASDRQAEHGLIRVMRRPLDAGRRAAKRTLDVSVAGVALLVLSPIMLVVAAAIRLDSRGPVIFRQLRHGYNHRSVEVWKFRSMYFDLCDSSARRVVTRDDPRVTRVGRFIRKWSLDELPQLINVLRGDLSLVGPRPHVLAAVSSRQEAFEELVEGYAARHKVPPGVTGWAQINGWRGEIDDPESLQQRFEHDLYYIENWSIWLDLYVLLKTPFCLVDTRRAY